jgi:protoheme IX farnesyltransferase
VRDYIDLLKPRVMSLVVFTGWIGVLIAPVHLHPFKAALAVLAIALGSGAAGAINMWYERDLDALMARPRNRPLPAGRVAPDDALGLGVLLSMFSVLLMAVSTNLVAAALLTAAILFYVFVYTIWLKRRTPQNIVIGGAAGALPPIVAWAAVTGEVTLLPVLMFAIIFLWTPPHFWALALYRTADYDRVGVPMLPVVSGRRSTLHQILAYTVVLVLVSLLPTVLGLVGLTYGFSALVLGLVFLAYTVRLWRQDRDLLAMRTFRYSIFYLFLLFGAFALDRAVQDLVLG